MSDSSASAAPLRGKHFKKSGPAGSKPGKVSFTTSKLAQPDAQPIYVLAQYFQKYFHLPEPGALYALMGAVAANMTEGQDPVWLMLVGSSGSGKTALLKSLVKIPGMYPVGDIDSKAAFLSGVKKKEQLVGTKGGMLNDIGSAGGAFLWYEFTAVLELPKDALKMVLTSLRQIFDGYYWRNIGTDGGRRVEWKGRLGAFGGVTNAIDRAHEFSSHMGERFIFYRLPVTDGWGESYKSLETEDDAGISDELAEFVSAFFHGLGLKEWFKAEVRALEKAETMRIIDLAQFASKARSGVERDYQQRDITAVPQSEMPMRLSKMLRRLYLGMELVGVDEEDRWRVLKKIALDSMPLTRRTALEAMLMGKASEMDIGGAMLVSQTTVKRTLEDLRVHGVVRKIPPGPRTGDADEDVVEVRSKGWELTPWAKEKLGEDKRG